MRRISAELEQNIVMAYQCTSIAGKALASEFGIGATTLYRVLRRNKVAVVADEKRYVPRTRIFKFSPERQAEIARLYSEGIRPKDLRQRFGCSAWMVREIVRRHGLSGLRHGGQSRPWSEAEKADMVARFAAKESQESIASVYGTHQTTVSRILHSAGVDTRRVQERHGSWKGGRVNIGGYVGVNVAPDHPFASMRHTAGYILEHRLVMAQSLGRPLRKEETVHHINGDRADNRIENLQLRQGRHGHGVAFVCADCGSHNIVERDLKQGAP